jgi:hypothetical protein
VAHTYNPSCSGGRDLEDRSSKSGQIVHEIPSWRTLSQKIGLVEWLKIKALSSNQDLEKKTPKNKRKSTREARGWGWGKRESVSKRGWWWLSTPQHTDCKSKKGGKKAMVLLKKSTPLQKKRQAKLKRANPLLFIS